MCTAVVDRPTQQCQPVHLTPSPVSLTSPGGRESTLQGFPLQANRAVKQQENRLQVAWQTRNEALAATGELRGRIEGLRRERLACGEILRKSQATLESDQQTIVELLTISAAAAEQRVKVTTPHPPCLLSKAS